jgi:hypothetical protein
VNNSGKLVTKVDGNGNIVDDQEKFLAKPLKMELLFITSMKRRKVYHRKTNP